ncbi:hypothetical protein BpHYR1_040650 [Brachionus plicatilis]|uniref:Uncharacterized protein n=1 Tax=Brachionus plicatilis TaxID=10195 RepID=A0A3M7QHW1_BRAPC|nr:hypothetical protein BpHYR1_040650 [Brachionus plicatilis]
MILAKKVRSFLKLKYDAAFKILHLSNRLLELSERYVRKELRHSIRLMEDLNKFIEKEIISGELLKKIKKMKLKKNA